MKKAVFTIFLGVVGLALWVGCWIRYRIERERSATIITRIASFKETLDPEVGSQTVTVFAVVKESTSAFDAQDFRSSRVELKDGAAQVFPLPLTVSLVARSAEAIDLDRNGTKELLLYGDGPETGIVWMRERKLHFRPKHDLVDSGYLDPTPQDAGDGHMVFVVAGPGVYTNGMHGVARRRVMAWTAQDGFKDVTTRFPKFVRKKILLPMKEEMLAEEDAERRKNFEVVINELEALISGASSHQP